MRINTSAVSLSVLIRASRAITLESAVEVIQSAIGINAGPPFFKTQDFAMWEEAFFLTRYQMMRAYTAHAYRYFVESGIICVARVYPRFA